MTDGRVPGVAPPSRTDRNERRRRSRRVEAIVLVLVVVVAGVYAGTRTTPGPVADHPRPAASSTIAPQPVSALSVLSVTGGSSPMILVVGTTPSPVAIAFPQRLTQVVPGMGEASLAALAQLDGATVRIGVSNTLGVWVRHYGVASVRSLASAVDAAGGLPVDLGRAFKVNGAAVGPGEVTLTGTQATAYLTGPASASPARWGVLSAALLRERLPIPPRALIDSD
ncbi:MAG: LCP family protein, partial [Actinomycetota bacterium]